MAMKELSFMEAVDLMAEGKVCIFDGISHTMRKGSARYIMIISEEGMSRPAEMTVTKVKGKWYIDESEKTLSDKRKNLGCEQGHLNCPGGEHMDYYLALNVKEALRKFLSDIEDKIHLRKDIEEVAKKHFGEELMK